MATPLQTAIDRLTEALQQATTPAELALLTDKLITAIEKSEEGKERLWTLDDVGRWLNLKRETVRRMAADEQIPHIKLNSVTLFDPARLRKWALSQEKQMNRVYRR